MANKAIQKVPARYIGHHRIGLIAGQGPFYNTDGTIRAKLTIERGDELLMPAEEILGYTVLEDPHSNNNPLHLDVGRVVLPEDVNKSLEELAAIGYRFNMGRQDFMPLIVDEQQSSSSAQQEQQSQQETMQDLVTLPPLTINASQEEMPVPVEVPAQAESEQD